MEARSEIELDSRVQDYLDDKLQTPADLASIDGLLEDLRTQHNLLARQLREAQSTLQVKESETSQHRKSLLQRTTQFSNRQTDLDRRLRILTQSDTSDEAVPKFEELVATLQKYDIANEYIRQLSRVDDLITQAQSKFHKSPQEALEPYIALKRLLNALHAAQPAAEGAAPQLVHYVETSTRGLWQQMKEAFAGDFERILEQIHWPAKDVRVPASLEGVWTTSLTKLLDLQQPELGDAELSLAAGSNGDPSVLLPLEVMTKSLELRFRYHFEGDRPTNRIEKPEYFLSHGEGLISTYDEFFATYLQPILQDRVRQGHLPARSIYMDSSLAWITALLPMLRHKLKSVAAEAARQPQLLSHLIHELLAFDERLRTEWSYDAGNSVTGWKGLTWDVLVKYKWFEKWLAAEKDFALKRYKEIIEAPEGHELDYDSVGSDETKPTYITVRVNDLLETITDRYRLLASFSQKLRFLIDIQIEIFDMYHARLSEMMTNTKSIEKLCHIYGSAEYLEKKMRDWSEEIFFLELYEQLQDRVQTRPENGVAGPLSVEDVAQRTSTSIHPASEDNQGALFDETAASYKRLKIKTEIALDEALATSIRDTLGPYAKINPWSAVLGPADQQQYKQEEGLPSQTRQRHQKALPASLTAELDPLLQKLRTHLAFLRRALGLSSRNRIGRHLALVLQNFLWHDVLMRHQFSVSGIVQFRRDVEAIWATMDTYLGPGQSARGMRRLREALILLSLPQETGRPNNIDEHDNLIAPTSELKPSEESPSPWDDSTGEANDDEDSSSDVDPDQERTRRRQQPGLWEVEKLVFRSNESARAVLARLGLETLTEMEARNVLGRVLEVVDGRSGNVGGDLSHDD